MRGAAPEKCPHAGFRSGAGGDHVIDEEDGFSLYQFGVALAQAERALHVLAPLSGAGAGLRFGGAGADEEIGNASRAGSAAHRRRQ